MNEDSNHVKSPNILDHKSLKSLQNNGRKTFTEHDRASNKSENYMDKVFMNLEEKDEIFGENKSDDQATIKHSQAIEHGRSSNLKRAMSMKISDI